MKIELLFTLLCLAVVFSCTDRKVIPDDIFIEKIDFANLKKESLNDFIAKKKTSYILLNPTSESQRLSIPEKILFKNGIYYMLDLRKGFLVAYDFHGNGISNIGSVGKGKNEYLHLCDFTVTDDGTIYAVDGRIDKLFKYDKNFKCVQDVELPFEADVIEAINDTTLLFGLSSWNSGKGKGFKIVKGDIKGNLKHKYFPYDEFIDTNVIISPYNFVRSRDCIAYNQTINDSIYIFDINGKLSKVIYINFEHDAVPKEMKKDVDKYYETAFKSYTMLRHIFYVSKRYIVGELLIHKENKTFIIDRKNNTIYLSSDTYKSQDEPAIGVTNGALIYFIDFENKMLPDSINNHLRNNGAALKLKVLE